MKRGRHVTDDEWKFERGLAALIDFVYFVAFRDGSHAVDPAIDTRRQAVEGRDRFYFKELGNLLRAIDGEK